MFIIYQQTFEWCNYVKLSGKMKNKLPFELPCEDNSDLSDNSLSPFPSDGCSQGTINLSNDDLALDHMNDIYKQEIPDFQSLWCIYQMEKDAARKKGYLKRFPKFTNWTPEGSQVTSDVHLCILKGLQPTAVVYQQFLLEVKQHSNRYLYISSQHPNKRPTTVFYSSPSDASSIDRALTFGIIKKIYQHTFAQNTFMWAAVTFYRKAAFIPSCGLWCSEDAFGQTVPVLLSHLSHPLTTAVDENLNIWFLDIY